MKKQFAKLSKAQQQKVEAEYHGMKPNEFDSLMSQAKPQTKRLSHSSSRSAPKRKSKAAEKRPVA